MSITQSETNQEYATQDPERSIFLPNNSEVEQTVPTLESLMDSLLGGDWDLDAGLMDQIAKHYPNDLERVCDRLQSELNLGERGRVGENLGTDLIGREITEYLYYLIESYRQKPIQRYVGRLALRA